MDLVPSSWFDYRDESTNSSDHKIIILRGFYTGGVAGILGLGSPGPDPSQKCDGRPQCRSVARAGYTALYCCAFRFLFWGRVSTWYQELVFHRMGPYQILQDEALWSVFFPLVFLQNYVCL